MDLDHPFTAPNENNDISTEPAIPAAEMTPIDTSATQDSTTSSRRLRPRRAKASAAPNTILPTQSAGPRRSTTKSTASKKQSRAASKKKAVRKEAALTATQAEQHLIADTPAAAADSVSQSEAANK